MNLSELETVYGDDLFELALLYGSGNYWQGIIWLESEPNPNVAPDACAITAPAASFRASVGETLAFTGTANDPNGNLTQVELWAAIDGAAAVSWGVMTGTTAWTGSRLLVAGDLGASVVLTAVATDSGGLAISSATVTGVIDNSDGLILAAGATPWAYWDAAVGTTPDTGISAWADKLGSGRTWSQASGTSQPVLNATGWTSGTPLPALVSDGGDDFMACDAMAAIASGTNSHSIIIAVQSMTITAGDYLIGCGGVSSATHYSKIACPNTTNLACYRRAGADTAITGSSAAAGAPRQVLGFSYNGATQTQRVVQRVAAGENVIDAARDMSTQGAITTTIGRLFGYSATATTIAAAVGRIVVFDTALSDAALSAAVLQMSVISPLA